MKEFIYTIPGKLTLFLSCLLSVFFLIGSIGVIAVYTCIPELDVYSRTEEEIFQNMEYSMAIDCAYPYANLAYEYAEKEGEVGVYGDYYAKVTDQNDKVIFQNSQYLENESPDVQYAALIDTKQELEIRVLFRDELDFEARSPMSESKRLYQISLQRIPGSNKDTEMKTLRSFLHLAYGWKYLIYGLLILSLLGTIVSFTALMCSAARRPGSRDICPGALHRIPGDLFLMVWGALTAGGIGLSLVMIIELSYDIRSFRGAAICLICGLIYGVAMVLGLAMSVAGRIKTRTIWKNTICSRILRFSVRFVGGCLNGVRNVFRLLLAFLRQIPLVWKLALGTGLISLAELTVMVFCYYDEMDLLLIGFFLEKLVLIPLILMLGLWLRKLQRGGEALASGNLSYVTDTKGMVWDLKRHGEHLNSIARGMNLAVEDRIRSERMKTELITNVSHDLKTPLTSIINYAGLIGNEPTDNSKIHEYSEVLVRQSERLKRLIEDLVEASKASTGNLDVNLAPCDASIFLDQAAGEYQEKLEAAELTLMVRESDREVHIMADGRRMWRVFDNLMNNICKYSQPRTRVYLSLEVVGSDAVITFKNTSREALNMTEEELMERFTRGDSSRHAEGNGLGLSIARSMAELQGGRLELIIDGDLFKAILTFPLI